MTTEVNLLGMLQRIKQTDTTDEEQKRAQQRATFHGKEKDKFKDEQEERAKRGTKPPPNIVIAGIRLPAKMKKKEK